MMKRWKRRVIFPMVIKQWTKYLLFLTRSTTLHHPLIQSPWIRAMIGTRGGYPLTLLHSVTGLRSGETKTGWNPLICIMQVRKTRHWNQKTPSAMANSSRTPSSLPASLLGQCLRGPRGPSVLLLSHKPSLHEHKHEPERLHVSTSLISDNFICSYIRFYMVKPFPSTTAPHRRQRTGPWQKK